jgi:hypothetical protein
VLEHLAGDDEVELSVRKRELLAVEVMLASIDPAPLTRPRDRLRVHVDADDLLAGGVHRGEGAVSAPDIEHLQRAA